jgi:hypothetical protein
MGWVGGRERGREGRGEVRTTRAGASRLEAGTARPDSPDWACKDIKDTRKALERVMQGQ